MTTAGYELAAMRQQASALEYLPRISVIMVVSDADELWIKSSVGSVLGQIYPHLELCICDNGSKRKHVPEVLKDYAAAEERIQVRRLPDERSRAEAYNAALSLATGEFVALLGQGDEISPEALFKVVELLQRVRADVIYTDEDQIDVSGGRSDPVFKPYWSPELLMSTAYTGRLCVMRKDIVDSLGGFREGFERAEEHDLILRLSERSGRVYHLPDVLYHRRALPGHVSLDAPGNKATSHAIEDALARREENATVEPGLTEGSFRVVRRVGGRPRVGVIVCAPEGMTNVPLAHELEQKTSYPIHQLIVAGVGREAHPSAGRVNNPFPTRRINLAAAEVEGDYLVFIDARARITDPGWLMELLGQARRRGVGAVGCKLLNASGDLRHGGSLVEMTRLTGYPERPIVGAGNMLPLVDHAFDFGAASSECMLVRRAMFERVGGFDDENLPTAFYDLDLSFRLHEIGLRNVYTPYTSVVCGGVRPVPNVEEIEYMWNRWWERIVYLLYYQRSPLDAAGNRPEGEIPALISS